MESESKFAFFVLFSPGVTITELQKRGGLNEEAYANVSKEKIAIVLRRFARQTCTESLTDLLCCVVHSLSQF